MAITTTKCCLNLSPPSSTSTAPNTTHQIPRLRNENWRRQCLIGMGCVIIGLEMNDFSIQVPQNNIAMAIENSRVIGESRNGGRWSDKRICPSWNLNSLETIVPENLPRPAARRRWESVGQTKNIPASKVEVIVRSTNGCFTM